MTSERFHALFGGPPRQPESRVTQREMDLARSIQDVCELAMLRMARHARRTTGERRLCLAHFERMAEHHRRTPPVREALPKQIVRDRIAEFSGARVQVVEDWNPAGYEANLGPWEVSAQTRALAELCLVLLNSNEFLYLH